MKRQAPQTCWADASFDTLSWRWPFPGGWRKASYSERGSSDLVISSEPAPVPAGWELCTCCVISLCSRLSPSVRALADLGCRAELLGQVLSWGRSYLVQEEQFHRGSCRDGLTGKLDWTGRRIHPDGLKPSSGMPVKPRPSGSCRLSSFQLNLSICEFMDTDTCISTCVCTRIPLHTHARFLFSYRWVISVVILDAAIFHDIPSCRFYFSLSIWRSPAAPGWRVRWEVIWRGSVARFGQGNTFPRTSLHWRCWSWWDVGAQGSSAKSRREPRCSHTLCGNGFLAELSVSSSCQLWRIPGGLSARAGGLSVAITSSPASVWLQRDTIHGCASGARVRGKRGVLESCSGETSYNLQPPTSCGPVSTSCSGL